MSCYFRHLKDILEEANIVVTRENKKLIDQAIHQIAKVSYKDCPATGRKLKQDILSDDEQRRVFIKKLRDAIS